MIDDYQIAILLQAQYDGQQEKFDTWYPYSDDNLVSWALKNYDDFDIICFEGSHDFPDWKRDFEAEMIPIRGLGGIHAGFYEGLPEVLETANSMLSKDRRIIICGHSLGGGEAHIFTGMLASSGYTLLETVTFGSPLPGDQQLSDLISSFPNRSYWNYHDELNCDIVGKVPVHIPIIAPYIFPRERILIDQSPYHGDSWGMAAWHHLNPLYINGTKKIFSLE